ncbi:hypothetical protein [Reyranella sp.]|uniref:hypothetical protein n=1 Tax=Reyranella sp. TaxID=1929291 RepID=UPI003C7E038F
MTTLSTAAIRPQELGDVGEYPVIASDIIYAGAAVGLVAGTGHARPLVGGDKFVGFAEATVDNSAGAAAAKRVRTLMRGMVELPVTDAVITDVEQAVYAQDDNAFSFNPVAGSFIGYLTRFVSAGVGVVSFDITRLRDPWARYSVRELLSGTKTFDAEDTGKLFVVDADGDGDALTLPAIATGLDGIAIMAIGAFGTTAVTIAPNASDMILGPDITGADNKSLILTKATQRRGDFVILGGNDADGYAVQELRGTWARQA